MSKLPLITSATPESGATQIRVVPVGNTEDPKAYFDTEVGVLFTEKLDSPVFTSEEKGLVPAGGVNDSLFLRADGQWMEPPSSVSIIAEEGSPITVTENDENVVIGMDQTLIAIEQSQVTDLVTDLGNKADKSVTATAGAGLTGGGSLASDFSFALDTLGTAKTDQGSASKTVKISTDTYGRVSSLVEQDINFASNAVTSLTGTPNQVLLSGGPRGAIILSLPQSIATTSSPQFAGITTASAGAGGFNFRSVDSGPVALGVLNNISMSISAGAGTTGQGGTLTISGGTGFSNAGGPLILQAGSGTTNGSLSIGVTNTGSVTIGATGITTTINGTLSLATALASTQGGTGFKTYAKGDLLYASAIDTLSKLTATTDGYVLTLSSGSPVWAPASSGVGTVTNVSGSTTVSGLTLSVATQTTTPVISLTGTLGASSGGTGASGTLTGYVKANGASAMTASSTIPVVDVSGAAPLASPAFTGTPTATTAAVGTNSTQLATTEFVATAVSGGVNSSVPYDYYTSISGSLAPLTYVMTFKAPRIFTLAATGHQGGVAINPTSSVGVAVYKNASQIGTLTISSTGVLTSSFSAAVSFAVGDLLRFYTPTNTYGLDGLYVTLSAISSVTAAYDLPIQIDGVPVASTKVVSFKAPRAFTLQSTGQQGGVITPPSASVSLTLRKNNGVTPIGTVTFTSGGTFSSSFTSTSFAVGDVLSIETPTNVYNISGIYLTLCMVWS